jgi:hypothetical protein
MKMKIIVAAAFARSRPGGCKVQHNSIGRPAARLDRESAGAICGGQAGVSARVHSAERAWPDVQSEKKTMHIYDQHRLKLLLTMLATLMLGLLWSSLPQNDANRINRTTASTSGGGDARGNEHGFAAHTGQPPHSRHLVNNQ